MKRPVIEFKDFSFQYRAQAKPTLNNINLTIYEGEKVLIVGPSGSGKSTLSNCINGLVPFSYKGEIKGSLKIKGQETKNMSIAKLSNVVGTVLQDPDSQFIGLTVGEDIAFKLENDCIPQEKMKETVNVVSKIVGIDGNLESSPHRLSGGQKQRVMLAGVMVDDVDILLFDEPLASLDPATGKNAIELIEQIREKINKTILIVEHRLEDVLHCNIDRIIVVDKGEMVSIVGKNGAGKSTVLKLISGFYKPSSGRVLFNGKDIKDESIKERAEKIGVVMQNSNQMISKSMIFDEVALGLKVRDVDESEIKTRVHEALKICGLYEFRNWPISALSYGQKKRVTIASILVLNPEIIILDEPTAGQDFRHYTEIMEFLKEINSKGVTIIMITHDMHLMLEYTNRAIVLADGLKIADDIASNVITDSKVIEAANLKETSVYELAVKANLENPRSFVKTFIDYDRSVRE